MSADRNGPAHWSDHAPADGAFGDIEGKLVRSILYDRRLKNYPTHVVVGAEGMGRIPPDKDHPLYQDWTIAIDRFLNAVTLLEGFREADPEFAAVHSECEAARAAYEAMLDKLVSCEQVAPRFRDGAPCDLPSL